jgi:hypothetical protein
MMRDEMLREGGFHYLWVLTCAAAWGGWTRRGRHDDEEELDKKAHTHGEDRNPPPETFALGHAAEGNHHRVLGDERPYFLRDAASASEVGKVV